MNLISKLAFCKFKFFILFNIHKKPYGIFANNVLM